MEYDPQNIFARILRSEIPVKKVLENEHCLAFHDAFPKAPVHILLIPKGTYLSFDDFSAQASEGELTSFFRALGKIARDYGLDKDGYRIIANHLTYAGQEVFHFHMHLLGGVPLGPMVCR